MYSQIPNLQILIDDIWDRYYKQLKLGEEISIYCDADMADEIIDALLDEMNDSEILDEDCLDLLDMGSQHVLVSIDAEGVINIQEAFDDIGEITMPKKGYCYLSDTISFAAINKLYQHCENIIVFGIDNNKNYLEIKDDDGNIHGFWVEGINPDGSVYKKHVFSSDALDKAQLEILYEIL